MHKKKYHHLTQEDRDLIAVWKVKKVKQCVMAKRLKVDKSTISRELKRNTLPSNLKKPKYLAHSAQQLYENRRKKCVQPRKLSYKIELKKEIVVGLQKGWSPKRIVGRLKFIEKKEVVCHETIYKFIYDTEEGKTNKLYEYLPLGKRRRAKWKGRRSKTDKLVGRKFIDQRPKEVSDRKEFGHYETDSIVCSGHKPTNVIAERKSRKLFVNKINSFKAKETEKAIIKTLLPLKPKSITGDNGFEFSNHERIEKKLNTGFYFTNPYHSWEKGTVENRNKELRKYIPRKTKVSLMTQKDFEEIAECINNTPLEVLGYLTPNEVYSKELLRESCTRC
jgi:IS30 family transposase